MTPIYSKSIGITSCSGTFERLLYLCDSVSHIVNRRFHYGLLSHPDRSVAAEHFARLTSDEQNGCVARLQQYLDTLNYVCSSGGDLENCEQVFSKSLSYLGLRTISEVTKHVSGNQVVEIYGLDLKQRWRSFSFFEYCTHDLFNLITRTWPENFKKPEEIDTQIGDAIMQIMEGRIEIATNVTGWHEIEEIKESPRLINLSRVRCIAPLFKDGNLHGVVGSIEVKSSRLVHEPEFQLRA